MSCQVIHIGRSSEVGAIQLLLVVFHYIRSIWIRRPCRGISSRHAWHILGHCWQPSIEGVTSLGWGVRLDNLGAEEQPIFGVRTCQRITIGYPLQEVLVAWVFVLHNR